ncbi:MAG: GNAT family protein [Candidatus Zixiibacteriota bacterium]
MAIELISLFERPELAPEIYDLDRRNLENLSRYSLGPVCLDIVEFRAKVASAINLTLDSNSKFVDIRAIMDEDAVVGCLDIVYCPDKPDRRTIGYTVDVDGGHGNKGYAKHAVELLSSRLLIDGEIDFLEAFVHPNNIYSRRVMDFAGFTVDNATRTKNELRYIRLAEDF